MAVYERTYKRWTGGVTPTATRFTILPRYAFRDVFASRIFLAYFVACFSMPIFCCAFIYLSHNASFLKIFPDFDVSQIFVVDAAFFYTFLKVQAWFAFVLALIVGPRLISRDLANNGLPLYLSRPFSRVEYLLGKGAVLATLLSAITWVAGCFLLLLHANFIGLSWLFDNIRLVFGVFVGSWLWIITLSLFALAAAAWSQFRTRAAGLMVIVLLGAAAFGEAFNNLFKSHAGDVLDLVQIILVIWAQLLGVEASGSPTIGPFTAWVALGVFVGACLLILHRKLRAYQVVS
ncbi:MAG: hypothetical protein AAGE94_02095 [Acidobacteriota bacterium]